MRLSDFATGRFWQLAVVLLAQACATPQAARIAPIGVAGTTIVVVRHAEKSTDDPRDPSLSAVGQQRARDLSAVLKDAGVTDVYVTQYKRTRQTAEPLAQASGISIVERPIDATNSATYAQDLAHEILTRSAGKSVLVVGHSNTVPDIVKALSGAAVPPITDAEYDHIFVVTIPAAGSPRVMQLRFGRPAPPSADSAR
ncbi:MAG TPA: phosphoglycerate mutase family protein [Gemmatimonadaceae bacterium]